MKTSVLQEAKELLSRMTRAEKAQMLQWVRAIWVMRFPELRPPPASVEESPALFAPVFRSGFWYRQGV